MIEVWKDIPDSTYEISSNCRVRNKSNGKLSSVCLSKSGYLRACIKIDGKWQGAQISRLMMSAFKGKSDLEVDHINGDTLNNSLSNLRYVTPRQNRIYDCIRRKKLTGAYRNKNTGKWQSTLIYNNKKIQIGTFLTEIEAHQAYLAKLKELNEEYIWTGESNG